jgi:hypothetical protein
VVLEVLDRQVCLEVGRDVWWSICIDPEFRFAANAVDDDARLQAIGRDRLPQMAPKAVSWRRRPDAVSMIKYGEHETMGFECGDEVQR